MASTPTQQQLMQDLSFNTEVRGITLKFLTTWGLFSPKSLDEGSRLLIENFEINESQSTLDIGCGYGPIGIAIAKQSPRGTVHMVDKDFVAVEYTQKNAELNNIKNYKSYLSNGLQHISEELRFDNVVSNLPAKVGNEMLSLIMHGAYDRLNPGGRLCVVTISGLKEHIKRSFKNLFGNYKKLKQGRTYTVASATKE